MSTHAQEGIKVLEDLIYVDPPNRKVIHGAINYYLPEFKRELSQPPRSISRARAHEVYSKWCGALGMGGRHLTLGGFVAALRELGYQVED